MIERPRLTILLDSSFLISLVKQRRDFERELSECVPQRVKIKILDLVLLELERLARKSPSTTRTWARASLELIGKRGYEIVEYKPGPTDVDASMIAYALSEKTSTAIATIDRELGNSLKSLDVRIILPRRGHGLILEGWN